MEEKEKRQFRSTDFICCMSTFVVIVLGLVVDLFSAAVPLFFFVVDDLLPVIIRDLLSINQPSALFRGPDSREKWV